MPDYDVFLLLVSARLVDSLARCLYEDGLLDFSGHCQVAPGEGR